jgi:hypothetical protein
MSEQSITPVGVPAGTEMHQHTNTSKVIQRQVQDLQASYNLAKSLENTMPVMGYQWAGVAAMPFMLEKVQKKMDQDNGSFSQSEQETEDEMPSESNPKQPKSKLTHSKLKHAALGKLQEEQPLSDFSQAAGRQTHHRDFSEEDTHNPAEEEEVYCILGPNPFHDATAKKPDIKDNSTVEEPEEND